MVSENFDVDKVVEKCLVDGEVLTPVPDSLTIHWAEYSLNYYFDEVFDGSSLVWVDVIEETFNSEMPEYDWTVDDPGTLYGDDLDGQFEDAESSPIDLTKLQNVADKALENYQVVFGAMVSLGAVVEYDS